MLLVFFWENVPEFQRLVASTGNDGRSIWGAREVQDPHGVPRKHRDLLHRGIFPDIYLVQRVAMSAHQLIHAFAEKQVAHLGPSVDAVDLSAC